MGQGCSVRARCSCSQWGLRAQCSSSRLLLSPVPEGPHNLPLSHSSDGDTDSVSTMVVHDVEEIAGTQTPYGGGTMVVQRVSGPPFSPASAVHSSWP